MSNTEEQARGDEIPDHHLTGAQLDDKYNPDGDGQHPDIGRSEWRAAVDHQETISGYWDWVAHQLKVRHERT